MELRPYQLADREKLRQAYRERFAAVLYQLATGAGKTIVFCAIVEGALARNLSVLVVVHRIELLHQAVAKLRLAGIEPGIIAAGHKPDPSKPVQVGAIGTLVRRLGQLPQFGLIVLDEAHHARASSWKKLLKAQRTGKRGGAWLLGVTATPARLDGRGLGAAAGGFFDILVIGEPVSRLMADGYLCQLRVWVPDRIDLAACRKAAGDYDGRDLDRLMEKRSEITGNAVEHYTRLAAHQPAIAFCVSVAHAQAVASAFRAAGYNSEAVWGGLAKRERDRRIAGLQNGEIEVLTACDLISEGVDVPELRVVIQLRPTLSLVIHLQQIGRGMRPGQQKPGGEGSDKTELIVLDHVGNCILHGLPQDPRGWSLEGLSRMGGPAYMVCPKCGFLNKITARVCAGKDPAGKDCGHVFPEPEEKPRRIDQGSGDLAELTEERRQYILDLIAEGRGPYYWEAVRRLDEAGLLLYAKGRGFPHPDRWVYRVLQERAFANAS